MHIIGTAGHVDHGKSSLVHALTGVDPDRWAEEQERGMTLDLGFAHLDFGNGVDAGIVDVPGHERFLHNMLAGAAGMELLLLVVAATEGVMPQTREHLAILGYLNVRRTIVAITKSDLLPVEGLDAAVAGIRRELRGTLAEDAHYVAVSNATGAGLCELRAAIFNELSALPPRDADAPVYMPIDRVFALHGRGTIVTGTLMQGRIAVGDTLALEPSGVRARVRSLQVFGQARDAAIGGTRVAINLPGVDRAAIARGEVVADKQFSARSAFTVRFTPLAGALGLLRRRTPVRAHIGSDEITGTLHLAAIPSRAESVEAELVLRSPVLAFPGVRFVVRRLSPKTLLGGGEIAAIASPAVGSDEASPAEATIGSVLREAGLEPLERAAAAFKANLREDVAQDALDALVGRGEAMRVSRPLAFLDGAAGAALLAKVREELQKIHDSEPWTMGGTSLQLSRSTRVAEALLVRMLLAFVEDGAIVQRSGYYALASHQAQLSAEQRAFFDAAVAVDPMQPFVPASYPEVADAVKCSSIAGALKAFDMLLARGSFVRVGDALYRGSQIAAIHERVEAFIDRTSRMTMAEFRDLIGTSRKYAVPLLEWFDSRGITVRSGDYRMLRTRKGARG
ncbi:MAG TPA: selenocysteine-specific translation elongation factor [Candidatus Baltobacteraceae bacterium]|nr:selenocysteine-specific translation elongation factor [Candidatus Baltobacteraceae bacterium]